MNVFELDAPTSDLEDLSQLPVKEVNEHGTRSNALSPEVGAVMEDVMDPGIAEGRLTNLTASINGGPGEESVPSSSTRSQDGCPAVENILERRTDAHGKNIHSVEWKGMADDPSWEPEENLPSSCAGRIKEIDAEMEAVSNIPTISIGGRCSSPVAGTSRKLLQRQTPPESQIKSKQKGKAHPKSSKTKVPKTFPESNKRKRASESLRQPDPVSTASDSDSSSSSTNSSSTNSSSSSSSDGRQTPPKSQSKSKQIDKGPPKAPRAKVPKTSPKSNKRKRTENRKQPDPVSTTSDSDSDSSSSSSSSFFDGIIEIENGNYEGFGDPAVYGPMFRRFWRNNEIPLCILGSTIYEKHRFHLIRLKPSNPEELAAAKKDPYNGLNEKNCVFTFAETFGKNFPRLVIKYYQKNMQFVENAKSPEEITEAAARAGIMNQYKENKVRVDVAPIFNDMMGKETMERGKHFLESTKSNKHGIMNPVEDDEEAKIDKVGLPEFYEDGASGSEGGYDSCGSSSSSEDEYVEVKLCPPKKKKCQ